MPDEPRNRENEVPEVNPQEPEADRGGAAREGREQDKGRWWENQQGDGGEVH